MRKQQTGSVLMIVLMIVVTMIALVALMTMAQRTALRRTQQLDTYQQIHHDVDSATRLVQIMLQDYMRGQPLTSLDQPWSLTGKTFPLENARLQGRVQDMRNCYNVNALHALVEDEQGKWPDEVERLVDLMVALGIKRTKALPLTAKLWDFIDGDSVAHHDGGEDAVYLGRSHDDSAPYFPPNQRLIDISEIRAVDGLTKSDYDKIVPYLCALPDDMLSLNINTLTPSHGVLLTIFSQQRLNENRIRQWLGHRPLGGWQNVEKALSASALSGLSEENKSILASYLRVNSDYFLFDGTLERDKMTYRWFTVWHWQDPMITPVFTMEKQ